MGRPRASAWSSGQAGTLVGPVGATDQHHRRDRGLVGVVVLAGVLEHLLDRPARARQEDDAGVADLQQDRLTLGVAHVLGDRGGQHVGRFVAVEPGRDAQRVGAAGIPLAYREGGPHPRIDRRPERRDLGQEVERVVQRRASPMPRGRRRGWRPPSRPARRRSPPRAPRRAGAPAARRRGSRVCRAASACPPITPTSRRPATQSVERLVDRVVVQRLGHRGVTVVGGLRPGVRAGVEAVGVRRGVVELLGPVEVVAVEVDRCARQVGHDDRAAGLGPLGVARREPAAQEQRTRHADVAQLGRSIAQVDGAHPPAAQRRRAGRQTVVEVGQGVDLDAAASAAPHGANLPGA